LKGGERVRHGAGASNPPPDENFDERTNMKTYAKISAAAAVILALAGAGVSNARAGGWPVAAGVVGGFAAGAIVGTTLANPVPPPVYYAYPPPVYAAPVYVPAPVVAPAAPVYYCPAPVVYPGYYPPVRLGVCWGRPHPYYLRR
jgi:hypothetical protein